jgi:hypothetical protein
MSLVESPEPGGLDMNRSFIASVIIGLVVLTGAAVYAASRPGPNGQPCLICRLIRSSH